MRKEPLKRIYFKDWIIHIMKIEQPHVMKLGITAVISYRGTNQDFYFEIQAGDLMINEFKERLSKKMLDIKALHEAQENMRKFEKELKEMELNESDLIFEEILK